MKRISCTATMGWSCTIMTGWRRLPLRFGFCSTLRRRTLAALLPTLLPSLLLTGCPPVPAIEGDAGSSLLDAGALDRVADAGDNSLGDLALGDACQIANDLCDRNLICARVFDQPTDASATCWPACAVAGPCVARSGDGETSAADEVGDCVSLPGGASVCLLTVTNLAACGDAANQICAQNQLCAFAPDLLTSFAPDFSAASSIGHCVTPCAPSDPTTCANDVDGIDCGCGNELSACSVEGIRLTDPAFAAPEAADGVCIAPTSIGDVCGTDPGDERRLQCSPGQRCDAPDGGLGTCGALP